MLFLFILPHVLNILLLLLLSLPLTKYYFSSRKTHFAERNIQCFAFSSVFIFYNSIFIFSNVFIFSKILFRILFLLCFHLIFFFYELTEIVAKEEKKWNIFFCASLLQTQYYIHSFLNITDIHL